MTEQNDPASVAAENILLLRMKKLHGDCPEFYVTEIEMAEIIRTAYAEQTAELKRMKAIVERLPKTADGVPVTPGKYFYVDPVGYVQGVDWCGVRFRDDSSCPSEVYLHSWQVWSTREAAEQANAKTV